MTTSPEPSPDEPPILDTAMVTTLRRLKLIERLYPAFITALPGQLSRVKAASEAQDLATLAALAHLLRGSSGQLGATALSLAFGAIEDALAGEDGEDAEHGRPPLAHAELEALAQATIAAMAREVAATPGP